MRFSQQVVLVAGGTGGLGRAVSLAFLAEGARVTATYRNRDELDALSTANPQYASSLDGRAVDVTDQTAVEQLVSELVARHGRIDALVNTVGGFAGGSKLWESDAGVFEQMLKMNLRSGLTLCHAVAPAMLKQKRGSIVNVASKSAFDHTAGLSAYAASKAAAVAMIDSLAQELKGSGVRVNSVLPSIIDTEANRTAMPNADFSKWPKPEEIARVILFLCSDEAKVIHGASVPVYGDS
jgi:NAD(P)-dependent dehydrogenase (short-subunit alcohol dehydrogenase family)